MDLLFTRYASPFSFINGYIRTGQFEYFVEYFIKTVNREKEEKARWEFFLHKVYDKSYKEFNEDLTIDNATLSMTEKEKETAVLETYRILKNFKPTDKKVGEDK